MESEKCFSKSGQSSDSTRPKRSPERSRAFFSNRSPYSSNSNLAALQGDQGQAGTSSRIDISQLHNNDTSNSNRSISMEGNFPRTTTSELVEIFYGTSSSPLNSQSLPLDENDDTDRDRDNEDNDNDNDSEYSYCSVRSSLSSRRSQNPQSPKRNSQSEGGRGSFNSSSGTPPRSKTSTGSAYSNSTYYYDENNIMRKRVPLSLSFQSQAGQAQAHVLRSDLLSGKFARTNTNTSSISSRSNGSNAEENGNELEFPFTTTTTSSSSPTRKLADSDSGIGGSEGGNDVVTDIAPMTAIDKLNQYGSGSGSGSSANNSNNNNKSRRKSTGDVDLLNNPAFMRSVTLEVTELDST